jgi:hypothetical protein
MPRFATSRRHQYAQDSVFISDPDDDDHDGDSDDRMRCQMAAMQTTSGCNYERECVYPPRAQRKPFRTWVFDLTCGTAVWNVLPVTAAKLVGYGSSSSYLYVAAPAFARAFRAGLKAEKPREMLNLNKELINVKSRKNRLWRKPLNRRPRTPSVQLKQHCGDLGSKARGR